MSLVSKAFSDIVTFSRSSNATRIGPTGRVEYAPHNLILQSQTLDNASWSKTAASITANALAAPDGTVTADKLVENTATSAHFISQAYSVTNTQITFSLYVKASERSIVLMELSNNATGSATVFFNVSTGVISTAAANGGDFTNASATISNAGNGWYRCTLTANKGATNATAWPYIQLVSTGTTTNYTGNGYSGIFIWGAQLSVGPYPLDYTPTISAAVYGPRFDYDPVTLAARGLLIEEQRTNSILYSEQFDNAAWTKTNASISANAVTAPDGTNTADKFIASAITDEHVIQQNVTTAGSTGTYSVYFKKAEYKYAGFRYYNAGSSRYEILCLNLDTGTVDLNTGGSATTSVTVHLDGWYRLNVSGVPVSSGTFYMMLFFSNALNGVNTHSYLGNGSSGGYIWGAQFEAGGAAFATSYIPTVAASVTRSADVASVNTLSPWWNNVEGTLFADYTASSSSYPAVLSTDANNHMGLIAGSSGAAFDVTNAGVIQATIGARVLSAKIAARFKANDFAVCVNGGAVATDTAGSVPSITDRLALGYYPGIGLQINGHLRRVAFYPRALTSAELQAITA